MKCDKTKQNKTLSILTAKGGENFREETATNRIKCCGNIQKDEAYEKPTYMVPRTDLKAIQLGQQG